MRSNVSIAVGSDPDMVLYRRGEPVCRSASDPCYGLDDSVSDGDEEMVFTGLAPGTYVLEVSECSYLGEFCRTPVFVNSNGEEEAVILVTVTQP